MASNRIGLMDVFPGLGSWVMENRAAIERPFRERGQTQAETLLGAAPREASATTDEMGLTTGFDSFGGTGLMEDPEDFYNQMQYGLGLMATPYYEQAGQTFMSQAVQSMLQRPMEQQRIAKEQERWQAEQEIKRLERERELAMRTGYGENKPYANQTEYNTAANALQADAVAATDPLRSSLRLYGDVQRVVGSKGLTGMSLIDDTLLVKTLAKVQNPTEAVMEGDVKAIAASDTYDQLLRTLAGKVGLNKELNPYERQMLYDALQNMATQRAGELDQFRGEFTDRAVRRGVDPRDILNPMLGVDSTNYRGPDVPKPLSTSGPGGGSGRGLHEGGIVVENPPPGLVLPPDPPGLLDYIFGN
jgi:hypothetical protein